MNIFFKKDNNKHVEVDGGKDHRPQTYTKKPQETKEF